MAPKVDESLSPIGKMSSPHAREWEEDDEAAFSCSLFSPRNWGGGDDVDERNDVLSAGPSLGSPMSAASLNPINPVQDKHAHENGPASGAPQKDNGKKVAFVVKNPTPLSPLLLPPISGEDDDEDIDTETLDDNIKTSLLSKAKQRGAIGIRVPTPKATGLPPPSPNRTPVVRKPKMVQIPDDESEASLMVLMRYMGCTPKAYGERPHSQLYGCGFNNPTGKEFVCDSEDDQDTLLTEDYETESVNSLASLQDPSQSWTKIDDSGELVGKKMSEKAMKEKDAVKLTKGARKEIKAGEVVNNGLTAIKPTVSSMKYKVNLKVDTGAEQETIVKNNALAKNGPATSPSAISPRSDATSPTLAEAMAAVAAFKKSSVDATSPLSTATLLSHASIAAAKSENAVLPPNAIIASPYSPTAATSKSKPKSSSKADAGKQKKAKTPMNKDIKIPAITSPTLTNEATVETNKKFSEEGEKKKLTNAAFLDAKIESSPVAPSSSTSGAVVKANTKMSVGGKTKKDITPSDKKIKTPSVELPPSILAAIAETSKSNTEGKKWKDSPPSGEIITTPSVTSPSSTTSAIIETSKTIVKGKKTDDTVSSDTKTKSPSLTQPSSTTDAIVGTENSTVDGNNKQDVTSLDTTKSSSLVSPTSTSTAVDEASAESSIKEKTKKASTKSCVGRKTKEGTASLDKKTKSPSVASTSSTSTAIKEKNTKGNVERITKKVAGTLDEKSKASPSRESTPKDNSDTTTQSKKRIGKGKDTTAPSVIEAENVEKIIAVDEKLSSFKKMPLSVNTECEKIPITQPISPISPPQSYVREVDKLLSQTRNWLARHSETQSKKQDSVAHQTKKDGTSLSLLNSSSSKEHRAAESKMTLPVMTGPRDESRPVSPPTLNELLHSRKVNSAMSPASPSSPLFALSGSTSFPSSPISGKSIKEQLEEIRAKQRELELRQKAKLDQET